MDNLLKSELFKLRKNRSFWTLIVIIISMAAAFVILNYIDASIEGEQQATGLDYLRQANGGNSYMIKLGLSILAGFFIASEYSTGVMKTIASSGSSRLRIYWAKLLIFSFAGMIISLVFPVTMAALATLLTGFGELPVAAADVSSLEYALRLLGLSSLYAIAFAAIIALFSTLLTESGKTIGISIIFFTFIDAVMDILGQLVPAIETLEDYLPFRLSMEIDALQIGNEMLFKLIIVPVITFAVFGLLGGWAYSRKEIK